MRANKEIQAKKFLRNHLIVADTFVPGTLVMVRDDLRTTKMEPQYAGPFKVLRRNRGGAYVLQGPDPTEYTRPPSVLKAVSISMASEQNKRINPHHPRIYPNYYSHHRGHISSTRYQRSLI
jgi:hypothetical protein